MADNASPKRRVARPSGGTIIMLVAVMLGVSVLAPTLQQFVAQRQKIADLHEHIATAEAEIAELQTEQARWNDPAYIQAQARGRLLFVKPGETTYLVTDSQGGAPAPDPVDARPDMHETETDWTTSLGQSFVTSGFANAPGPGEAADTSSTGDAP